VAGALALTALLAASVVAPAQAAFPGVPGSIAYRHVGIRESGDVGGIFAHGPRHTQAPHRLTTSSGDSDPSYSADGRMIVFSGNHDPAPQKGTHIYLVKADGSGVKALTSGASRDSNPCFSPDGLRVVFDRASGDSRSTKIFVVNADGTGLRQLSKGTASDSEPAYAPNGRWIAFVSDRRAKSKSDHGDIFSMKPDGSRVKPLIGGPYTDNEPDVSPDGRQIVFASTRSRGPNVFVASVSGRNIRQITHSRRDCFSGACYLGPVWAPDGKHLAFIAKGRFSSDLEVVKPDGSGGREFADGNTEEEGFGTSNSSPSWGPAPR
jgi:TolB protein